MQPSPPPLLLLLSPLTLQPSTAATITGHLSDISIQDLNTKIMFAPTNEVLLVGSGLSAGPPRIIDTVNGAFSVALDAGDYTVSLPLVTWRHPFCISVPESASSFNITNLLCNAITYTYTNHLVSPLHVNNWRVTAWSTNGESSLVSSTTTIGSGLLHAGSVITIEAFGSISDPSANLPDTTFKLKLGSTAIATQTQSPASANWHLRSQITVRTNSASGTVVGTLFPVLDNPSLSAFGGGSQTATLNTTVSLTVDLRASIVDSTGAEAVHCDQLTIHFE